MNTILFPVMEIDVRPKETYPALSPFEKVMKTATLLHQGGTLIVHSFFDPDPLLFSMKQKGFHHHIQHIRPNYWVSTFQK